MPNGVVSEYEYTRRGWIETLTQRQNALGPVFAAYDYTDGYDAAGNRITGTETVNGQTVDISWGYDDANRLIFEERKDHNGTPFRTTSYVYDDAGNRESETLNGVLTSYTYNNLDQLISESYSDPSGQTVTTGYQYDGRGNLTEVSVNNVVQSSYGYDVRDRMVEAYVPGSSIIYSYNDDGRRVAETVNGITKRFIWDEFSAYGDVIAETDASNAVTTSYVLGGNQILWQTVSGTTHYLLADAQGSTRTLTDNVAQNAQIQGTYNFTAFGETLDHAGSADSRYLYTGQQFDPLTELYSLRARYYSPSNGRFLARDTWAYDYQNPVEFNRYVYAASNPVTLTDPSGLFSVSELGTNLKSVAGKTIGTLKAFGTRSVGLLYSKSIFWISRVLPRFLGGVCLFGSLSSGADLGPGCDAPLGELIGGAVESYKRIFQVGPDNQYATAAETIRRTANLLGSDTPPGPKNISISNLDINGVDYGWHVAISGSGTANPTYKSLVNAAEEVLQVPTVGLAGARHFKTQVVDRYDRFVDGEAKLAEHLWENILSELQSGDVVRLDVYSERDLCVSCLGVMDQLFDQLTRKGVIVNLNMYQQFMTPIP